MQFTLQYSWLHATFIFQDNSTFFIFILYMLQITKAYLSPFGSVALNFFVLLIVMDTFWIKSQPLICVFWVFVVILSDPMGGWEFSRWDISSMEVKTIASQRSTPILKTFTTWLREQILSLSSTSCLACGCPILSTSTPLYDI